MPRKKNPSDETKRFQFLRIVRDATVSLENALLEKQITDSQLSRWLASRRFRMSLGRSLRIARRRRALELEMAASCGARRLSRDVQAEDVASARQVSRDVIALCKRAAPPRTSRAKKPEEPGSPVHPDVPAEEADRLLEEMEKA